MALTLINRVRAITGSSTSHTSADEVLDFVRMGARFVLSSLPVELSFPFARDSSFVNDSTPIYLDTNKLIPGSVRRGSIRCIQVPLDMAYDIADSNSLHYATARYPAFYVDGYALSIKPTPTATAVGRCQIVDIPNFTNGIDSTSTSKLGQYDGIVVKYAAALDYMGVSSYWGEKLLQEMNSTEITGKARDALQNAADLINNKTDYDAEDFLAEEDAEMVASAVQTAAQEVNRAMAEMQGGSASAAYTREMAEKAAQLFKEADRELQIALSQGVQIDTARNNGEGGVQTA